MEVKKNTFLKIQSSVVIAFYLHKSLNKSLNYNMELRKLIKNGKLWIIKDWLSDSSHLTWAKAKVCIIRLHSVGWLTKKRKRF